MIVSWFGLSDFTPTFADTATATCTPPGPFTGVANTVNTATIVCTPANAATTPYTVTIGQSAPVDYTVDFKVDGTTVPELSGTMSAVASRDFQFTNEFDGVNVVRPSTPTDTQLNPAKGGDFLSFALTVPTTGDTYALEALEQPTGIAASPVSCPTGSSDLTAAFVCPFYADNVDGAFEYRLFFSATAADAALFELLEFDLDISSNGVILPGGPQIAAGSGETALFTTFLIRADSGDGPVTITTETPPVEFKVTFTTAATVAVVENTIAVGVPAGANCVSTPTTTATATAGQERTVIFSCRDYAMGTFDFTFGHVGATDITYTTSYLGNAIPGLSGTLAAADSVQVVFDTPATEGDPLTNDSVNTTP